MGNTYRWYFRGQADAAWALQPSIVRSFNKSVDREFAINLEHGALYHFKKRIRLFMPNCILSDNDHHTDWWALMQHYSCPTRLLDWTLSPYVALYFAVRDASDKDGAVWLFETEEVQDAMMQINEDLKELPNNEFYDTYNPHPHVLHVIVSRYETDRSEAQQGGFTVCTDILSDHGEIMEKALGLLSSNYLHRVNYPS